MWRVKTATTNFMRRISVKKLLKYPVSQNRDSWSIRESTSFELHNSVHCKKYFFQAKFLRNSERLIDAVKKLSTLIYFVLIICCDKGNKQKYCTLDWPVRNLTIFWWEFCCAKSSAVVWNKIKSVLIGVCKKLLQLKFTSNSVIQVIQVIFSQLIDVSIKKYIQFGILH